MASSRSDVGVDQDEAAALTGSPVAFALQELAACWAQAYEAMTRGDLHTVARLLDQADAQLAAAGDRRGDSAAEAKLRSEAASAHGRLRHAMRAGIDGIREELGQTRRGAKAMRGYGGARDKLGVRVTRSL